MDTLGVAGVLLCLAAGLVAWAGHSLVQAEPAPAVTAAQQAPAAGGEGIRGSASTRREAKHDAARKVDRRADRRAEQIAAKRRALKTREADKQAAPGKSERPVIQAPIVASGPPDPKRITIPALQVDQNLVELAVNGTSLQVPDDYWDVGWWSDGPSPGQQGAAVAVGHVDSDTGPAVFYGLSGLRRDDRVRVRREDGAQLVFAVRKKVLYQRNRFPSDKVYRSAGRPGLNLLTCGGSFDPAADLYSGNVVVYTELINRIPKDGPKKDGPKKDRPKKDGRADR